MRPFKFESVAIPFKYGPGHVFDHIKETGIRAQNLFEILRPVRQHHIQNESSYNDSLIWKNLTLPSHEIMNPTSHFIIFIRTLNFRFLEVCIYLKPGKIRLKLVTCEVTTTQPCGDLWINLRVVFSQYSTHKFDKMISELPLSIHVFRPVYIRQNTVTHLFPLFFCI